ncbi:type II toxin-antitoxin system Phd/YefM family antitoxin [Arthrobacter sp. TMT4-20]
MNDCADCQDSPRTRTPGEIFAGQREHLPQAWEGTISARWNDGSNRGSVADARNHLSDVIARSKSEAVFIERRGQRAAVIVSPEQYERMLDALEDAEDVVAFDEAIAEEGPNIPWAQVKADLGWT